MNPENPGNQNVNPGNVPSGVSPQDYQDYVNRYQQQGPQAISEQEAHARYGQVAPQLPPQVYQQSAQDVFAQLSPEQRMQLGQALVQSARQQGQSFPDINGDGIDDRLQDPNYLAQVTTQVHQQQPGLLGQLFGGGAPQGPGMPAAGGQPGGGNLGGGQAGSLLGSPVAKGVLGGIAAIGLANMLGGGDF